MACLTVKFICPAVLAKRFYSSGASKKAVVLMAEGTNELEMVPALSLLRRAGIMTTLTGVPQCQPMGTQCKMFVTPDNGICEALMGGPYDAAMIPGGRDGVKCLASTDTVGSLLREIAKCDKIIGAIGHGPLVLKAHCIWPGKCITANPCLREELSKYYKWADERVVKDGALITSQGPGSAFDWVFAIIECLQGREKVAQLKKELGIC